MGDKNNLSTHCNLYYNGFELKLTIQSRQCIYIIKKYKSTIHKDQE